MHRRQPLPRLWLMTDERMGDALWPALARLPRGSGVVFRHYKSRERRALFDRVRQIARRRGLMLILAGAPCEARRWRADGAHGRVAGSAAEILRTASVHSLRELCHARADLVFVSPVFATRSHPGATALGPLRFATIAARAKMPVIALGGMDRRKYRRLKALGAYGWAGIDALTVPSGR